MSSRKPNHKIVEEIAILKESKNLWKKELNLVSWNGAEPKFDIRWWSSDKTGVGKGITFTREELDLLADVISKLPRNTHRISE